MTDPMDTLIARLKDEARTWPVSPLEHLLTEAAEALIALHQQVAELERSNHKWLIDFGMKCKSLAATEAALASLQTSAPPATLLDQARVVIEAVRAVGVAGHWDAPHWTLYVPQREINALFDLAYELDPKLVAASAPPAPEPQTMNITKVYPCGCSATGHSSIPDYCPTHPFVLSLHRCKICGTRWLLWPAAIHGGGWNLLDKYSRPGACCDNVAMGEQIEHLRDIPLQPPPAPEPEK